MYLHVHVCQKIWGHSYFAFICMCKCSVNFSKFDIYTCKFSAVKERGGKKGGGGVTDKNCQKNQKNNLLDLDFDFLYKDLRTACTFYSMNIF